MSLTSSRSHEPRRDDDHIAERILRDSPVFSDDHIPYAGTLAAAT